MTRESIIALIHEEAGIARNASIICPIEAGRRRLAAQADALDSVLALIASREARAERWALCLGQKLEVA